MKKLLLIFLSLVMVFSVGIFAACNGGSSEEKIGNSIVLSRKQIVVDLYERTNLSATVTGVDQTVEWTVSDDTVITFTNGEIIPKKGGRTVITAAVEGASATCEVIVSDTGERPVTHTLFESTQILAGSTKVIGTNVTYKDNKYTDMTVEAVSSDEGTVKYENGKLLGVAAGTAEITVITTWRGYTDSITLSVTVIPNVLFYFGDGDITLYMQETFKDNVFETNKKLTAYAIENGSSVSADVTFSSENSEVATISKDGTVTAVGFGTTTVIGKTTISGKEFVSTANVTVLYPSADDDGVYYVEKGLGNAADFSAIDEKIVGAFDADYNVLKVTVDSNNTVSFTDQKLTEKKAYDYKLLTENNTVYNVSATCVTMLISDKAELDKFQGVCAENGYGGYYLLTDNVDYEGGSWTSDMYLYNNDWSESGKGFRGTFDGQGYSIYNMHIVATSKSPYENGFIACVCQNGVIKNLGFANPVIELANGKQSVVVSGNLLTGAKIENIYVHIDNAANVLVTNGVALTEGQKNVKIIGGKANATSVTISNSFMLVGGTAPDGISFSVSDGIETDENHKVEVSNSYVVGSGALKTLTGDTVFATVEEWKKNGSVGSFDVSVWDILGDTPKLVHWVKPVSTVMLSGNLADFDLQNTGNYTFKFNSGKINEMKIDGVTVTGYTQSGTTVIIPNASIKALNLLGEKSIVIKTADVNYNGRITIATMVISDKAELDKFHDVATANNYGGYYVLDNNIDYNGATWTSIFYMYGPGWTDLENGKKFVGTFDGRGYCIYDMVIGICTDAASNGFIGCIATGAVIKNIGFIDPVMTASESEYGVTSVIVGVGHGVSEVNNAFVYISDASKALKYTTDVLNAKQKLVSMVGDRPDEQGVYVKNSVMVVNGTPSDGIEFCITNNSANHPILPHMDNVTYLIASSAIMSKYATDKNFATVEAFKSAGGATRLSTDVWDLSGDYPVLKNYSATFGK